MDKDFRLYGVVGTKTDSWLCCMNHSKLDIETTDIFKKIISKTFSEQENRRITKIKEYENRYIYYKKPIEQGRKKYIIVFEKTEHNEINTLYIKPYPCNKNEICDNIKALK